MFCSFFVQAGEGAVFAVIPLIKRSMTGQFAGMTGAYGNVGSVVYLTVLSLVSYQVFFFVIAATAVAGFFALFFQYLQNCPSSGIGAHFLTVAERRLL